MFKKILVPVDFSPKSHHALGAASKIAAICGGKIDLFHIVQSALTARLTETGEYESLGKSGQQMLTDVVAKNKKRIEKLADEYRSENCTIKTRIKVDQLPDKIAEHIHQEEYDLLIIGGELDYPIDQMMKENHSEKIVKLAKRPVLVINQPVENFNIRKIVIPTNLIDSYGVQLETLKQIQHFFKSQIQFVYINTPNRFLTSYETDELVQNFKSKYRLENCDFQIISDKSRKKGILNAAKYLNADMIGLLSFQNNSLMNFFRGDITEHLVNHSSTPMMVLHMKNEV